MQNMSTVPFSSLLLAIGKSMADTNSYGGGIGQGLSQFAQQQDQDQQYRQALSGAFGGGPAPGNGAQLPPTIPTTIPAQAGAPVPQSRGAATYDGPLGSRLGAQAAPLLSLLKTLPASAGFPLLLQTAKSYMEPSEFNTEADVAVNPATGKPQKYILNKRGELQWLPALPQRSIKIAPNGQAYDETATAPGTPFNDPNKATGFDAQGNVVDNKTYQDWSQREEKLKQAPQWATLEETRRHNRAGEETDRNPFGTGGGSILTGDEFLKTLPVGVANQVKAIANYRQAPPGNRTSKAGMALMNAVNQYNPSYDATDFTKKAQARKDFATGKNGNTVRSLNVAIQHLDQLAQLSRALGNGDIQGFNRLSQFVGAQLGQAAPTNFDAAKHLVGDEIVKAVVGAGGTGEDRRNAAEAISRAGSPQQLAGVIQTYQDLLGGQLIGLRQQYTASTGLTDFDEFLAPETRTKLRPHGGSSPGSPGNAQPVTKTIRGKVYQQVNGQWFEK